MDELQIRNQVLSKLGEDEQLDDPNADTRANRKITANWDATRDQVLRMHLWNFAIDPAGEELEADGEFEPSTLSDFTHRYELPSDFIRIDLQRLRPRSLRTAVRIGGGFLYASAAGPILIPYVARIKEVGKWDPLFGDVFACHMAAKIGKSVVGQDFNVTDMKQATMVALRQAKAIDGRENPPEEIAESEWTEARYQRAQGTGIG